MSLTGPRRPLIIVLTGGIASGKTAVSDRFAELGVPIVDTDVIARELVEPGQPELTALVRQFGTVILDSSGSLDRRRMRNVVFSDPNSKHQLEAILHPAIASRARLQIRSIDTDYCILVVPLLVESGLSSWGDRLLVVDVDEETQIERVMARDRVTKTQAESILKAQASRQERLALADDIIVNNGSLEQLEFTVSSLHEKYRALADSTCVKPVSHDNV